MSITTNKPSENKLDGWLKMPYQLGDPPANRAAIGLIVVGSDLAIEPELSIFLSHDGVVFYTTRISSEKVNTVETLRVMEEKLTQATALLPIDYLDVVAYGCTSGSSIIGPDKVKARIHAVKPGIPCTNPITSTVKALKALKCRRIALLTPYIHEINIEVDKFLNDSGFDIVVKGSFHEPSGSVKCKIEPSAIFEAGLQLGQHNVDALFISCTSWRVASIIEPLEKSLGKPVITSNQALAWDCLRLAGDDSIISGFGQLLKI